MLEWILAHGDRLSAFVLLLLVGAGAGLALYREWIVMGKSCLRELADKDRHIAKLEQEILRLTTGNERLVQKLEKALEIAEVGMSAATRRSGRSIRLPEDDERRG